MINNKNSQNQAHVVRRVTLISNPHYRTNTGTLMVNGIDNTGFQYQIDLTVLPANVTVDMIKGGQQWFVERRTTRNRLYLYCGQFSPHSQLRVSTNFTLPQSVWTNITPASNITVQSGSCGVTTASKGVFTVPIPGLYTVATFLNIANGGGSTRIVSSTLGGNYPTVSAGTPLTDVLCLTSGNLSFSVQGNGPGVSSPTFTPGIVTGTISITYTGPVF